MSKHRGHPAKRAKHNIMGLKNQSRQQSLSNTSDNSSNSDYSDSLGLDLTELDCLAYLEVDSDHSDNDNEADWDEVAQEEFQDRLFQLVAQIEEDQRDAGDTDWLNGEESRERAIENSARKTSEQLDHATDGKHSNIAVSVSNLGEYSSAEGNVLLVLVLQFDLAVPDTLRMLILRGDRIDRGEDGVQVNDTVAEKEKKKSRP
ncbi:hypothetical protein B0H13DRAFT_2278032 [Mycena leptocephala]|nr:hypothetical protein B0H13DRAFT_2278032 [Mycena leptocephala]